MATMPSTLAPALLRHSAAESELCPVEMRSSTITTLALGGSSPSMRAPVPWSLGVGRTYTNGLSRASATSIPQAIAPVATPAITSACG